MHPTPPGERHPGWDEQPRWGDGRDDWYEGYEDDDYDDEREPGHELGHGHGHGHGTDVPVSAHTTRIVTIILIPVIAITAVAVLFLWPNKPKLTASQPTTSEQRAYGSVRTVSETACPETQATTFGPKMPCGTASVHIDSGPGNGKDVTVDLPQGPGSPRLSVGDKVVLAYQPDSATAQQYSVTDHQRGQPLVIMILFAALTIIAFGRFRGLTALIALVVSFAGLLMFIIPAILNGEPPLLVAIVGASAIMFLILYLTHGVNVHTSVAVLGTLAALVLTGLLGTAFSYTTHLTGFGSEESLYLSIMQGSVDMKGLLLAGIIIGALGVLDDVTVTQAMAVAELAQGARSRAELYRAATRVGRAHVASAVNTIILAYAGASLPLLLLIAAGGRDVSDLLTSEFLAQEIVRGAVGTIGLVAAVPITTGLATLVADIRHFEPARRPRRRQPNGR